MSGGLFDGEEDLFQVPPSSSPPATRSTDPDTSSKAAARAAAEQETIRARVAKFAEGKGPEGFIDEELIAAFPGAPESSYRKRRSELTQDEVILDSGRRRKNGHDNDEIVWIYRDHIPGVPMPSTRNPDEWRALKNKAAIKAELLKSYATQMHKEGRVVFGHELTDAADILRQLSS